jgi:hypothetical protein
VRHKDEVTLIVWEDAEAACGWVDPETEWKAPLVYSVGKVTRESRSKTKGYVVLSADFSPGSKEAGDVNRQMRIPKGMIRKREVIWRRAPPSKR